MGYDLVYEGTVKFDSPLDDKTYSLIKGLNDSRRMILDVDKLVADGLAKKEEIGQWGEFYIGHEGVYGDDLSKFQSKYVINSNCPPLGQPSLHGCWKVTEDRMGLVWHRGERSYEGHEWIQYFVKKILTPRGYHVEGIINWVIPGMYDEKWHTVVKGNSVRKYRGYSKKQLEPDVEGWYQEQNDAYDEYNQKWLRKLRKEKVDFVSKDYIWKNSNITDDYELLFRVYINDCILFANSRNGKISADKYLYKNIREQDGKIIHDDWSEDREINDDSIVERASRLVEAYIENHPECYEPSEFLKSIS